MVRRAQIVLTSADGETNTAIARRLGTTNPTVCHWRKRWFELGLVGLYGEARPRRPRTHDEEKIAQLLHTVLQSKPADGTHWTVRSAASATGLSKSTVGRMLALFGVQPHRSKSFRLSTDPLFVDKVKDIVSLYLNPPDHAVVLCVDEKTQIQALERTQPVLPLGLGYLKGVTHDYVRHGTTTLFAALDIANCQVLTQCCSCHRHQEFFGFLKCLVPGFDGVIFSREWKEALWDRYVMAASWQRHDHARHASNTTAIAGFALGAERGVRDQPKNSCKVAEATDCRRSEDRS
uniref:IS630 family transposase n=1 Tax=Gluconobacter thailandicus TaxID=257438 RepID=UPI0009EDB8CE